MLFIFILCSNGFHFCALRSERFYRRDFLQLEVPGKFWVPAYVTNSKLNEGNFHEHIEPRRNGRDFSDDIFKVISFLENCWILIQISQKYIPNGPMIHLMIIQHWFR